MLKLLTEIMLLLLVPTYTMKHKYDTVDSIMWPTIHWKWITAWQVNLFTKNGIPRVKFSLWYIRGNKSTNKSFFFPISYTYKGQVYIWLWTFMVLVQTGTSTVLWRWIPSKTTDCMNKLIKMTSYCCRTNERKVWRYQRGNQKYVPFKKNDCRTIKLNLFFQWFRSFVGEELFVARIYSELNTSTCSYYMYLLLKQNCRLPHVFKYIIISKELSKYSEFIMFINIRQ